MLASLINFLISLIPVAGNLISGFWVAPSLSAGFLVVAHQISNGKIPQFAQFFDGFKKMRSFALVNLTMLIYAFFFIGTAVYLVTELSTKAGIAQELMAIYQKLTTVDEKPIKIILILSFFVILLPIAMLALFTLTSPFIIFENMDFWEAMQNSRKLVARKLIYYTLIFFLIIGLIIGLTFGIPAYILLPLLNVNEDSSMQQSGINGILSLTELLNFSSFKSIAILLCIGLLPRLVMAFFIPFFYTFIYAIYKDMVTESNTIEK